MSVVADIASAVASLINGGDYSDNVDAVFTYWPTEKLTSLSDMRVEVFPQSQTIEPATRDSSWWDCVIGIGIRKRAGDDAQVNAFLEVVQEVIDRVTRAALEDEPGVKFMSIANDPVIDYLDLDQQRVAASLISVTYRGQR